MRVILPQITQITQRGMQQAALYRRERQVGVNVVNAVLLFGVLSAIICVICERYWGFIYVD